MEIWRFNVDGVRKRRLVHNIVMDEFLGPQPNLQVNHKDLNKKNNNLDNLEFVTSRQNKHHYIFVHF